MCSAQTCELYTPFSSKFHQGQFIRLEDGLELGLEDCIDVGCGALIRSARLTG